jgi:hypothetical protein
MNARRVVVIVDATIAEQFLDKFIEMGVGGYNTTQCGGRGTHSVTGDPFSSGELIRIEMISSMEIGARILDYIHAVQFQQFGRYALTAFADTVEVDMRDRSLAGNGDKE